MNLVESVSYLFERGGKRDKRTLVARDATTVASQTAADAERQLTFQTEQAFINVLLAKSTLDLATENLKNFSNVLDVNRERMRAGDLAESRVLQDLAPEAAIRAGPVTGAEVALVQAKAALRQSVGFERLAEQFDVDGDLGYVSTPSRSTI